MGAGRDGTDAGAGGLAGAGAEGDAGSPGPGFPACGPVAAGSPPDVDLDPAGWVGPGLVPGEAGEVEVPCAGDCCPEADAVVVDAGLSVDAVPALVGAGVLPADVVGVLPAAAVGAGL